MSQFIHRVFTRIIFNALRAECRDQKRLVFMTTWYCALVDSTIFTSPYTRSSIGDVVAETFVTCRWKSPIVVSVPESGEFQTTGFSLASLSSVYAMLMRCETGGLWIPIYKKQEFIGISSLPYSDFRISVKRGY